jgi:hypothetical protein
LHGLAGLVARSAVFILIYGGCVIICNLSPDIKPVIATIRKRLGFGRRTA